MSSVLTVQEGIANHVNLLKGETVVTELPVFHINQEEMTMLTVVDGSIKLKDQLRDYKYRGEKLAPMNFLEFMLETYEDSKDNKEDGPEIGTVYDPTDGTSNSRGPGRPLSTRIPYQDEAGKGKRCRIVRSQGHETLPRFIGKWFCRSDSDHEKDLFRGSMLMLLKPWRTLHSLKDPSETFESAFDKFILQADERAHRVVANVQYYFECSDGAKAERKKRNALAEEEGGHSYEADIDIDHEDEINEIYAAIGSDFKEITDDDIERARIMKTQARDRLYGESAIALGYDVGFFEDADANSPYTTVARKMQPEEGPKIRTWEAQLKATTREQIADFWTMEEPIESGSFIPPVEPMVVNSSKVLLREDQTPTGRIVSGYVERVQLARLNEDQRRAHDIIEERLKDHITSEL